MGSDGTAGFVGVMSEKLSRQSESCKSVLLKCYPALLC